MATKNYTAKVYSDIDNRFVWSECYKTLGGAQRWAKKFITGLKAHAEIYDNQNAESPVYVRN